ncbi:MAG: hypothetical protein WD627_07505 [Actinomycetota bacterium]
MNKQRGFLLVTSVAAATMLIAMSTQALALTKTVSAAIGPVALPNVPVEVCIDDSCQSTPALRSVSLKVTAKVDLGVGTLPAITPGSCPPGESGAVLKVTTGTTKVTVAGNVTGTLPTGAPINIPVGPVTIGPVDESVTIGVCTTAG